MPAWPGRRQRDRSRRDDELQADRLIRQSRTGSPDAAER